MKLRFWIGLLVSLYASLLVSQKIVLPAVDLGRHLKNGQIFLAQKKVLATNTYSYTFPDFPVINHHWGIGVAFYLIYRLFGFSGLSAFYVFLIGGAVFISFFLGKRKAAINLPALFIASLLALPLIAYRTEVRPEGISFLLMVLDIFLLRYFFKNPKAWRKVFIAYLLVQILWVNGHIFFVFGIALSGLAAGASFLINRFSKTTQKLFFLTGATVLVSLINPFFIKGLLEPLMIFKNYGYMIVENQSIFFALRRLPSYIFIHAFFLVFLMVLSLLLVWRQLFSSVYNLFLTFSLLLFTLLSFRYIRALPLMGLVFLPWFSEALFYLKKKFRILIDYFWLGAVFLGFLVLWLGLAFPSVYSPWRLRRWGWGLAKETESSAQFFVENRLSGPIFNNYDIGSYLIWSLYPKEKVFVDNRPEAYPASFFQETYIPAQENESFWQNLDRKYQFNVIFFFRHDATPWAQPFLIRRLSDSSWVPVYVDPYALILVKNIPANQSVIEKYRLPKEIFKFNEG